MAKHAEGGQMDPSATVPLPDVMLCFPSAQVAAPALCSHRKGCADLRAQLTPALQPEHIRESHVPIGLRASLALSVHETRLDCMLSQPVVKILKKQCKRQMILSTSTVWVLKRRLPSSWYFPSPALGQSDCI